MAEADKEKAEEKLTEKGLKEKVAKGLNKAFPTFIKGAKSAGKGLKKGAKATGRAATYDVGPGLKKGAKSAGKGAWKGIKSAGVGAAAGYGALKAVHKKSRENRTGASAAAGWIFFFLSIALYISDLFWTKFNGIDIKVFTDLGTTDILMKSGFLSMLIALLIFQFLFTRPSSKEEWKWVLILDSLLIIIIILSGMSIGTLYHLAYMILLWLMIIKPENGKIYSYKMAALLLIFDFFGFSALGAIFGKIGWTGIAALFGNRLVFPIYTIYLLFYLGINKKSTLASIILFLLLFSYMGALVKDSVQFQTASSKISEEQKEGAITKWQEMRREAGAFVSSLVDPLVCYRRIEDYETCLKERGAQRACAEYKKGTEKYKECMDEALGKETAIRGKVEEEYTTTQIKFEELSPDWYENIPTVNSIDEIPMNIIIEGPLKNPVQISLSCKFKNKETQIPGVITPTRVREMSVKGKDEELISCTPQQPYPQTDKITAIFEATAKKISTVSILERVFVGEKIWRDPQEKKEILNSHDPPIKEKQASSTGDEFAAYTFQIGTNTFIHNSDTVKLIGKYEDLKREEGGKLLSVDRLLIDLRGYGIVPSPNCQKNGYKITTENNILWEGSGKPADLICDLIIPEGLKNLQDFENYPIGFESKMTYTYRYTKQKTLNVITTT